MKKVNSLIVIITLCPFLLSNVYSQDEASESIEHESPSLKIGLNGISIGPGDLDKQLIIEMIAEKQKEIKLKIIENMLLDKVYDSKSSGMIYSYASNVLKSMLTEPNNEVRTRIVLENTVNMVFAYSFADYCYRNPPDQSNMKALKKKYGLENAPSLTFSAFEISSFAGFEEGDNGKLKKDEDKKKSEQLISLLIDMSAEMMRSNEDLKALGIMTISSNETYDYANQYMKLKKNDTDESDHYEKAKLVYEDMADVLQKFIDVSGTVTYLAQEISLQGPLFKTSDLGLLEDSGFKLKDETSLQDIIDKVTNSIAPISAEAVQDSLVAKLERRLIQSKSYLTELLSVMKLCDEDDCLPNNTFAYFGNVILTIDKEIIPVLEDVVKYDPNLLSGIDDLAKIAKALAVQIKEKETLITDFQKSPFISLLGKLNDFDKTTTFVDYVALLPDLEAAFSDQNIKYGLSQINSFVKDYVNINKDKNSRSYMVVDVESLLIRLQSMRPNKLRKVDFLFTVGVNNAYFEDGLKLQDTTISNYSFVGEKIGLKVKLKNWGDWKPRQPGETYTTSFGTKYVKTAPPKDPIVSDWHLLFYGSGILYNIVNTGTSHNFDYPLIGLGTGLSFYNSLDLNVSYGIPIVNIKGVETAPFISVGFDVQFSEYFSRLSQKRQSNKNQKLLAEQK